MTIAAMAPPERPFFDDSEAGTADPDVAAGALVGLTPEDDTTLEEVSPVGTTRPVMEFVAREDVNGAEVVWGTTAVFEAVDFVFEPLVSDGSAVADLVLVAFD
jgi:hypothetical protein